MKNLFLIITLLIGTQSQAAIVTNTISNFRFSKIFLTSGTWTAPAGVTEVVLVGSGGGAGGGGGGGQGCGAAMGTPGSSAARAILSDVSISGSSIISMKNTSNSSVPSSGFSAGGGAGSGIVAETTRVKVIPGNVYTITIGAAGSAGGGGAAGGYPSGTPGGTGGTGGSGGDTTFASGAVTRTFLGDTNGGVGGAGTNYVSATPCTAGLSGTPGKSGVLGVFWDAPALP
jgi:hypothetical protein